MTSTAYCPERGDVVWLSLTPQAGHERADRRPALVLSPKPYNEKTKLALCCPITSVIKKYPFEVVVPDGLLVAGVVLSDQMRSLDWEARGATLLCRMPEPATAQVLGKARTLIA